MDSVLRREICVNKTVCRITGVLVFVILTSLGAFVRIRLPFTPVPITLQTLFVLLSGALLGSNLGAMAQLSYAFLGLSGLSIFTGSGSGFFYLCGPTGGYIFGFVLSVLFIGRFIRGSRNNLFSVFALLCAGDMIILVCGSIWLKLLLGYRLTMALSAGLIPFIPGDLIKVMLASVLYFKLKPRFAQSI